MQITREYREWAIILDTIGNPFSIAAAWNTLLSEINLDTTAALDAFTVDYETAVSRYTDEYIIKIFELVYNTNKIKYEKLVAAATAEYNPIDNYNMVESSTDVRTPDLTNQLTLNTTTAMTDTRTTTTAGDSTTTSKLNQIKNTTETPNNYTETSTHAVNPYDNPGFTDESKDTTVQSGNRTVSESYSGNADETTVNAGSTVTNSGGTSTTNSGINTNKETGTDTTEHALTRRGNIGVTTTQQMLESEMTLAAKMNIFKIIEQDIAAKLFLQVWI